MLIPEHCITPFNARTPTISHIMEAWVVDKLITMKRVLDSMPQHVQDDEYGRMDPLLREILHSVSHLSIP